MIPIVCTGLLVLLLHSCTSDNPLTPAIRDAWGEYNYFPYVLNVAWFYEMSYPPDTTTYEVRYHIDQTGYLEPYLGYRMVIAIEDIIITSQAWAITEEKVFQNNWDANGWFLQYVTPFVLENRWSEHIVYTIPPVTYNVNIEKEVVERKTLTVPAGTYEDCVKFREHFQYTAADLQYADSSYYYTLERWYAPNIGLIREDIVASDRPGLAGGRMVMKQFITNYQGSSAFGDEEGMSTIIDSVVRAALIHQGKMSR